MMLNIFSGAFYQLCDHYKFTCGYNNIEKANKQNLFISLTLFLIRCLGGYFTVEFKSSLYIFDTNPLLDV